MRFIKPISLLTLIIIPWSIHGADTFGLFVEAALPKIIVCYDASVKVDADFVKCISKLMPKIPNSINYKLRINAKESQKSSNGPLSILFYTQVGDMIYCTATAGAQLKIKACVRKQGKPISPKQEAIIFGP